MMGEGVLANAEICMRATSACPMPPGGLPQRVVEAVDLESCSSLASELLVAGDFSEESCLRLLRLHFSRPQTNRRKSVLGGDDRAPFHILGFFSSSTGPDNAFVILVHRSSFSWRMSLLWTPRPLWIGSGARMTMRMHFEDGFRLLQDPALVMKGLPTLP